MLLYLTCVYICIILCTTSSIGKQQIITNMINICMKKYFIVIAKTFLFYLVTDKKSLTASMRLFLLSSVSGVFEATEIQNPARSSDYPSPFPVIQSDLYKQSQPGTVLGFLLPLQVCYYLAKDKVHLKKFVVRP